MEDTAEGPKGGVDGSRSGKDNKQGCVQKPNQDKSDNKHNQDEQKKQEQADHNPVRALIVADSEEDRCRRSSVAIWGRRMMCSFHRTPASR